MRRYANRVTLPLFCISFLLGDLAAQKIYSFAEQDLNEAIQIGARQPKKKHGLRLAPGFRAAFMESSERDSSGGYRVTIYTPLLWVREISARAATQGRFLAVSDLMPDDLAPVLRVVVSPYAITGRLHGPVLPIVEDIELLGPGEKPQQVKPLWKKGEEAAFPLEEVLKLRNPRGDPEFYIVVWGPGGAFFAGGRKWTDWKIGRKQLSKLP